MQKSGSTYTMNQSSKPTLYYHPMSSFSRKALIALYEKRVQFDLVTVNLMEGEQFSDWFVELNPRGEVPVLKDEDTVVVDSAAILEYVDAKYGRPHLLFPTEAKARIDEIVNLVSEIPVFPLTYGVISFHANTDFTDVLRFPYDKAALRNRMKTFVLHQPVALREEAGKHRGTEAEMVLKGKAKASEARLPFFLEPAKFQTLIDQLEKVLDRLEAELDKDDRVGQWLCGQVFSAADITAVSLLMRLYQLGLDERMWKNGTRPNLAVYAELAFRRPSVIKATDWKAHEGEEWRVPPPSAPASSGFFGSVETGLNGNGLHREDEVEDEYCDENGFTYGGMSRSQSIDAARIGMGAVLVLGGIYAARKMFGK